MKYYEQSFNMIKHQLGLGNFMTARHLAQSVMDDAIRLQDSERYIEASQIMDAVEAFIADSGVSSYAEQRRRELSQESCILQAEEEGIAAGKVIKVDFKNKRRLS